MTPKNNFLFVFLICVFSLPVSWGKIPQAVPVFLQKSNMVSQLLTRYFPHGSSTLLSLTLGATLAASYFSPKKKVYAQEVSCPSSVPTAEELFKHAASYQNVNDVNELELSKNPLRVKQYLNLAKEHFVELYQTSHGFYLLDKLLKSDKSAVDDFAQLAIDNLTLIGTKSSDLIETIINRNSSYLDYVRSNNNPVIVKLVEKANQNFVTLATQRDGIAIVKLLARKSSQARECFAETLSKNISSLLEETYKKDKHQFNLYVQRTLSEIIDKFPTLKTRMQEEVEKNVSTILSKVLDAASNDDTAEIFLFLMELDKGNKALYAKTLIEDLALKKRDYKSLSDHGYFLTMLFDKDQREQFVSQAVGDLESIFSSNAVTKMILDLMKKNPTFANKVGAQFVQKVEILVELEGYREQHRRNDVLEACLENPEIKEYFEKALCEKFTDIKKICENKTLFDFVDKMIQKNPEFNVHVGGLITQHLTVFYTQFNNDAKYNYHLLSKHCLTNAENCRKFIDNLYQVIPNAEILFQDSYLLAVVLACLKKDADFAEYINNHVTDYFCSYALEKIELPIKHYLETYLAAISRYDEKMQQWWLEKALKNLKLACNIEELTNLLCHAISDEKNPEIIDFFVQSFINDFDVLEKTEFGLLLVTLCFDSNVRLKEVFIKKVEENIENVSPLTIALVSYLSPCNETVKKWIEEQNDKKTYDLLTMLKMQAFVDHCQEECDFLEKIPKNQTTLHMQTELKVSETSASFEEVLIQYPSIVPSIVPYYFFHQLQNYFSLTDPFIKNMIENVIEKEIELKDDYYTFIHGQRHEYLPQEQLHTFLQCVINKQKANNNYLLLHEKELPADQESLKQEKEIRKNLLKAGRTNEEERQRLLFVNWAFFANSSSLGSSSAHYITSDNNVNDYIHLTTEKVFSLNNLDHLYQKYNNQLAQLQREFEEITQRGTCILLAIPKEKIQKHIYLADVYGSKRKILIEGIGETDDIALIMKTLESTPEKISDTDKIEFCIPMTYDQKGALNPESGIKIFAFTAADKEKLKAYYAHQQEIFEQIKKDIEGN